MPTVSTSSLQTTVKRGLRRVGVTRETADQGLDRLRFTLDTTPALDYHPLPWLGKERGQRVGGTESRWRQIEAAASELGVTSAVDVGANVGWFSISLARLGISTLAIEREPKFFRTLLYARSELDLDQLSVLVTNLDQKSLAAVPKADLLLFLSVWHHMVRALGYSAALEILGELWARTEQVMFFDTGEDELPSYYGMPTLEPSPDEFFTGVLEQACPGGVVVRCGRHDAFAPNGEPCQRTLYAIFRATAPDNFPALP